MIIDFDTSENESYKDIEHDDYSGLLSDVVTFYICTVIFLLITTVIALVVISADIFLICAICRYKKLRVRTNMYILNCCILNIFYIISPLIFYILEHFINSILFYWLSILNPFLILYLVFAFALTLDWCISAYRPNVMQKFYKYIFAGVYITFFIEGSVSLYTYQESLTPIRTYIFFALYIISLIVVVIINILAKKGNLCNSSLKTAYSLTVTNIILFSFLPALIINIAYLVTGSDTGPSLMYIIYAAYIPELIVLAHPILVVYILGKRNKYFKVAYRKSFCNRRARTYGDENLDDASDDEYDNESCDVKVKYSSERKQDVTLMIQ